MIQGHLSLLSSLALSSPDHITCAQAAGIGTRKWTSSGGIPAPIISTSPGPLDRRWGGEKASQTIHCEIRLEGPRECKKIKKGFSGAVGELLCCDYRSRRYGAVQGVVRTRPMGSWEKTSARGLSRDCAGERPAWQETEPVAKQLCKTLEKTA